MNSRQWLADVPWELVVSQNLQLCNDKHAHHGPTSDGHAECRDLWQSAQMKEMPLNDMVDFCRRCHRLAPFTNYNGNTFAAIARIPVRWPNLDPERGSFSPAAWRATSGQAWPARRR